jgi:polysaccharide chain length determinant protein (PEP-CTERM system associated)
MLERIMKTIEVEPQQNQSGSIVLREYWRLVVRRKWVIITAIVLSLTAAAIVCKVLPKTYRSETLILVEDQKIAENYVQGMTEGNLDQRIFVIQKQIMNRVLLGEVVKEFQLYPEVMAKHGLEGAIAMAGSAIKVEMVAKGPRGNFVSRNSVDAFTVSFSHENPGTAMNVTAGIASRFIEENLKTREQIAQGTTEFLDDEVINVKRVLEKKEDEISRFKANHMGELPQQTEANLRSLDRLQSDLNTVNESMQRLADRLTTVERAILDYERFGRTNSLLVAGPIEPDPLFRRLKELKEKLIKLKAEFWDAYPDVILTKEEIRHVERELIDLYGPDVIQPGAKPLDPYLQDLKRQQSEIKTELALLKQRQAMLYAERKAYVKRVEISPAVEQELHILERDYENMKNNYRSLLDKRLNARVAENLEKRQKGAQFRIIDPANFPLHPDKPNRLRIMLFGFLFGCAAGVGLAMMQEQLNPQFRRPEDIENVLGPQLLAVIPHFRLTYGRPNWQRFLPYYSSAGKTNGHNGTVQQAIPWKRLLGYAGEHFPLDTNFVAKQHPTSLVAEQYRVAATRLALTVSGYKAAVVAVTSAVKGEGKTTTVINLGYTLARDVGKRTVLVDCDFKCPVLHRYAMTVPEYGLVDFLTKDVSIDACLCEFTEVPCSIMPVGNGNIPFNQLLKTDRLATALAQLREHFDYILINAPPILPLADMNVLAGHADLLLLVVRAGSTSHQCVKYALNTLRAGTPTHIILNAVNSQSLPTYISDYGYEQTSY